MPSSGVNEMSVNLRLQDANKVIEISDKGDAGLELVLKYFLLQSKF